MKCAGCHKTPDDIYEYVEATNEEDMTPDEFVASQEGTYDPESGNFLCTPCYMSVGMPSSPTGWTATPDNLTQIGLTP